MEFSFDRNRETSQTRSQTTGASVHPQSSPGQPAETRSMPHDDGIDTASIANERLRKAIEKNRARQAERNRNIPRPEGESPYTGQPSFFDKEAQAQNAVDSGPSVEGPPLRARAQERTHNTASSTPKEAPVVTRRSVARPNEVDFTPVKRTPKKVASQISYTTTGRKKSKPMDPTLVGYLVKGCWIFCAIMVLRLIFASGGITTYYAQRTLYNDRLSELSRIKNENMQLVNEIERMQTDIAFQKKLVRDNLGFIASDEFLVLFPKEKSVQ